MPSVIDQLTNRGLIKPPTHLKSNVHYECMMGSIAYGCSNNNSDVDVYGFSIPPKDMVFPHLTGYMSGFGRKPTAFAQYQQHHVKDELHDKEYDLSIFNIVKYFQLVMENNPNMIDSLFVPRRCILHSTKLAEHVRENRKLFLHKGSWHKFKGYAYSQLQKCKNKNLRQFVLLCDNLGLDYHIGMDTFLEIEDTKFSQADKVLFKQLYAKVHQSGKLSKRIDTIKKYGYDVKFAYHIIRLLNEVEQILTEHDLDLQRNREQLKSIRRGDWALEEVEEYFQKKELELEALYTKSTLRHSPDEEAIKTLLLECLEMHYGSIENCVVQPNKAVNALLEIRSITDKILKGM